MKQQDALRIIAGLAIILVFVLVVFPMKAKAGTIYKDRYHVLNSGAPCFYRFADGHNINLNMVKVVSIGTFRDYVGYSFGENRYGTPYYALRAVMFDGSFYQDKGTMEELKTKELLFLGASLKCRTE